jgi:hypothetical protein
MPTNAAVVEAALRLSQTDEAGLESLLGLREQAIKKDDSLKNDPNLHVTYNEALMGPLDSVRNVGRRVLNVWNKQLFDLVCGSGSADQTDRRAILSSLNLGEAAIIAVVASAVLSLGAPAALAAVLSPLIVKRFILPAKDELCVVWKEQIEAVA